MARPLPGALPCGLGRLVQLVGGLLAGLLGLAPVAGPILRLGLLHGGLGLLGQRRRLLGRLPDLPGRQVLG